MPAFSGLFAPYWKSNARGVIAGLTRYVNAGPHRPRDARGDGVPEPRGRRGHERRTRASTLESLKVDGGMVGNDLLMQFQADLLGVPVIRPKVAETTALGAAYAAGLATGPVEQRGRPARELGRGQALGADDGRGQARRVLQVLEEGRHQVLRLVRRRGLGAHSRRGGGSQAPPRHTPGAMPRPQDRRAGHRRRRHRRRGRVGLRAARLRRRSSSSAATSPRAPPAASTACCTRAGATRQGPARRRRVRRGERRSCGASPPTASRTPAGCSSRRPTTTRPTATVPRGLRATRRAGGGDRRRPRRCGASRG